MGGSIKRYTLNIIVDGENDIPFAKESLEMIDEVTSYFKDSSELGATIKRSLGLSCDDKNIKLSLTYNYNNKKRYVRILYEADKNALDRAKVSEKFDKHTDDKDFIVKFVKRYESNPYMLSLANDVIASIEKNEDYTDNLQRIVNLTFISYKSVRDIYFFIKDYERKIRSKENTVVSIPVVDKKKDLIELLKKLKIVYMAKQLDLFDMIDKGIQPSAEHNFIPQVKKKV